MYKTLSSVVDGLSHMESSWVLSPGVSSGGVTRVGPWVHSETSSFSKSDIKSTRSFKASRVGLFVNS